MFIVLFVHGNKLEIEQCVVVYQLEYSLFYRFSNAIVLSDETTPFQFVKHAGQCAVVCKFCGSYDFISGHSRLFLSKCSNDFDVPFGVLEQRCIQHVKLVAQLTAFLEKQVVDILCNALSFF